MKKLKIAILSFLALGATVLTGFSQGVPPSGSFTVSTLNFPTGPWVAGTATNLSLGWSSVFSVTNTSTTWNSSSNAFISVTNVVSATNTAYPNMSTISQKDLGVIITELGGVGTNTYTFARYLDSGTVDTNSTGTIVIKHTAAGTLTASTNFPSTWIGGFAGVQVSSMSWVAAADSVTNPIVKYGKIVSVK